MLEYLRKIKLKNLTYRNKFIDVGCLKFEIGVNHFGMLSVCVEMLKQQIKTNCVIKFIFDSTLEDKSFKTPFFKVAMKYCVCFYKISPHLMKKNEITHCGRPPGTARSGTYSATTTVSFG